MVRALRFEMTCFKQEILSCSVVLILATLYNYRELTVGKDMYK
jgi:hypothetical protein